MSLRFWHCVRCGAIGSLMEIGSLKSVVVRVHKEHQPHCTGVPQLLRGDENQADKILIYGRTRKEDEERWLAEQQTRMQAEQHSSAQGADRPLAEPVEHALPRSWEKDGPRLFKRLRDRVEKENELSASCDRSIPDAVTSATKEIAVMRSAVLSALADEIAALLGDR